MGGSGPRLNDPAGGRPAGGRPAAGRVGTGGSDPSGPVRDVHLAVRAVLRAHAGGRVVVGVSGGGDSLALLAAAVAVAGALQVSVAAVCVDHGCHPRTRDVAARVARAALRLGADRVRVVRVVPARGAAGGAVGGPEEAARTARLRALEGAAGRDGAAAVLLGHTLDDQAEQVLIGLARGSGARSLAGMPARRGPFVRPLLGLRRDVVRAACPSLPDLGLPWHDPTNGPDPTDRSDASYASDGSDPTDRSDASATSGPTVVRLMRARVRAEVLPVLLDVLGEGAVASLARSADLLRDDADALDDWATREAVALHAAALHAAALDAAALDASALDASAAAGAGAAAGGPEPLEVDLDPLRALPTAVRARVLRLLAAQAGARALTLAHTRALDGLVSGGRGHGPVALPGPVTASRSTGPDGCGRLRLAVDDPPREDRHGRR